MSKDRTRDEQTGIWRSLAELSGEDGPPADSHNEFPPQAAEPPEPPADAVSRRRFLALTGATAALAATAACSRADRGTIVPYNQKPEGVVPGVPNFYATMFSEGQRAYPVLVRTREGRPIHVEGNAAHPLSGGAAPPRAIADLLGLYDPDRLRQPLVDGRPASWDQALAKLAEALRNARASGKPVLLLSGAVLSPSAQALLRELKEALPSLEHVQWEPASSGAGSAARAACFGSAAAPRLRLDRARVVACFEADPLNGEVPELIRSFSQTRRPDGPHDPMSRLWVMEGGMSLTGAKADRRIPAKPSGAAAALLAVAALLHRRHGLPLPAGVDAGLLEAFSAERASGLSGIPAQHLGALAADLARAGREALVLAGSALPQEAHVACALLNGLLGAEGHTLESSLSAEGPGLADLRAVLDLTKEMAAGRYAAALIWGVNPSHAHPAPAAFAAAFAKVPLRARLGLLRDETARDCEIVLPESHWLESWNDFAPALDLLSLRQPCVKPLYDTRQGEDLLLALLKGLGGSAPADYHAYLMARWAREVHDPEGTVPFESYWNAALHEGFVRLKAAPRPPRVLRPEALADAAHQASMPAPQGFDLLLRPDPKVFDGRYANNGWLQEVPDPITKLTWGNAVAVSVQTAARLGLSDGDVVRLEAGSAAVEAPVQVQPGQNAETLDLRLGYGRGAGSVADGVGTNGFPLLNRDGGSPLLVRAVRLAPSGRRAPLPTTQTHHRMEGRDLARSWSLEEYENRLNEAHAPHPHASLYPEPHYPDHKWGMAIDLSACVGCSGCVVACQSENNIPVVGPEQVARGREMHWIRVDRYYEGAAEDPKVLHQPMLCQQCDNAPCENVCPVNATNHSPDGLNQMAYNRCVGTRYCANNCPYKVRRFNFFEYNATKKEPETLAFNPEVSVRPRGVMEKCTFCVQRIEDAKMRSKVSGEPIGDGEIVPACAAACPAEAIVFGDLKDPQSRVSKLSGSARGYKVLEELGVRPSITYLAGLRNPGEDET